MEKGVQAWGEFEGKQNWRSVHILEVQQGNIV